MERQKKKKNHGETFQQLIKRQARSITGIYPDTPIDPLLCEAGLIPSPTILDHCQRLYAYRLLNLPDEHPAKKIRPISLREEDGAAQPEENTGQQSYLNSQYSTCSICIWPMACLAHNYQLLHGPGRWG